MIENLSFKNIKMLNVDIDAWCNNKLLKVLEKVFNQNSQLEHFGIEAYLDLKQTEKLVDLMIDKLHVLRSVSIKQKIKGSSKIPHKIAEKLKTIKSLRRIFLQGVDYSPVNIN